MQQNTEKSHLISCYLPERILKNLSQTKDHKFSRTESLTGGVLFFDLASFTPLTKLLAQTGPRGAEKLQDILLVYFTTMIDIIHEFGGSIYQFAGDSALAAFEKEEHEDDSMAASRVASCAWKMKTAISNLEEINVSNTTYRLSTKFSISYGPYYQIILGNPKSFYDAKVLGKPIYDAVAGEKHSQIDTVVIDSGTVHLLKENFELEEESNFTFISKPINLHIAEKKSNYQSPQMKDDLVRQCSQFVLPVLVEKIIHNYQGFLAEFRDITSVFIHFDGLDYLTNTHNSVKMLNSFFEHIVEIANVFGGTLVQTDLTDKGNVFLVIFGAPVAQEQKELLAVRFAQKIHEMRHEFAFLEKLRIGISSGPTYCGDMGAETRKSYSVLGEFVNFASRIMTFSEDGMTCIDAGTHKKIDDFFDTKSIENVPIKGILEKVTLYQILSPKKTETKKEISIQKLFGRKKEVELFSQLVKNVDDQSTSMILVGDAGVGKTRLVQEFAAIAQANKLEVVISNSFSYEKFTPFFVWKNIFHKLFSIDDNDSDKVTLLKIQETIESLKDVKSEWTPVFGQILGLAVNEDKFTSELEPRQKNDRISQITFEIIQKVSEKKSILFIIEDFHWTDDVSRGLIKYIISQPLKNVMFLLPMRPDDSISEFKTMEHLKVTELNELETADAREYLRFRLNLESPNQEMENEILARAHGNPFFIESIVYSLREQKQLILSTDGKYKLGGSAKEIKIPDTLNDVLLSRIDRLREEEQAILKTASVMGRIFAVDLLKELSPESLQSGMNSSLSSLEKNDFTFIENPDPLSYIFKHILIRDVAYNSMVGNARRELHRKLANILEDRNKENLSQSADTLAHHYINAGESSKALEYCLIAAEKALSRYGNRDAIYYYEKSLELLYSLNLSAENAKIQEVLEKLAQAYGADGLYSKSIELFEQCLPYRSTALEKSDIYIGMGKVFSDMGDTKKAVDTFEKGLKLSGGKVPRLKINVYLSIAKGMIVHEINDMFPFSVRKAKEGSIRWKKLKKQSEILYNLDKIYFFEDVEKLAWSNFSNVIIADKLNDPELTSLAYANYGLLQTGLGMIKRSSKSFTKSNKFAEISGNAVVKAVSFHRFGMRGMYTNTPGIWCEKMQQALATFEEVSDLWEIYISMSGIAVANYFLSNYGETIKYYKKLLELAEKNQAKRYIAWGNVSIPFAEYQLGLLNADEAREKIKYGIELCKEVNDISAICTSWHYLTVISIRNDDRDQLLIDVLENYKHISAYNMFIPDSHIAYSSAAEGAIILLKNGLGKKSKLHKIIQVSIKRLLNWGKTFPYVYGPAVRVQAQYFDFLGKKEKARQWHLNSINFHDQTENRWETGLAYFEAGKALEDKREKFIDIAESIFKEKGMVVELNRVAEFKKNNK
ncbi:MAG: AAA family ATPase [Spirochaetia bacterium]|nr:AAA family ATPase [Spirochaetia bacterium]